VQADPAQFGLFHDDGAQAELRSANRRHVPARTGPDHGDIVFIMLHGQTRIDSGFSIRRRNAASQRAASAPSTHRWSTDSTTDIIDAATISPDSFTTGRFSTAPTARIAACGGLMMAENSCTPYIPRLLTDRKSTRL